MSKTKTYVVERVATDIYEIETDAGEAEALYAVAHFDIDKMPIAKRNLTEYRVYEKVADD